MYKGRIFYFKKALQVFLVLSCVAFMGGAWFYVRHSSHLAIKKVEVLGDLYHLTADDVIVLSRIRKSDRLFVLDLDQVRANVTKHPWVADVRVRREYPGTIQIHVTEREPQALLLLDDFYLVDRHGKIFKRRERGDPVDLPVFTGFKKNEIQQYPRLMQRYLGQTLGFLNLLLNGDFYRENPVSEVNFDPAGGFSVFTKRRALEIYYGRGELAAKQAKLEKFKLSGPYQEMAWVRLDLDVPGKVVARAMKL